MCVDAAKMAGSRSKPQASAGAEWQGEVDILDST
jgi:hypothetical protein